jgi:hypothetical protein
MKIPPEVDLIKDSAVPLIAGLYICLVGRRIPRLFSAIASAVIVALYCNHPDMVKYVVERLTWDLKTCETVVFFAAMALFGLFGALLIGWGEFCCSFHGAQAIFYIVWNVIVHFAYQQPVVRGVLSIAVPTVIVALRYYCPPARLALKAMTIGASGVAMIEGVVRPFLTPRAPPTVSPHLTLLYSAASVVLITALSFYHHWMLKKVERRKRKREHLYYA